ncbi:MAG: hypothetical protein LQ340_007980, partial [Diploschistes diacapsis]
MTRTYPKSLPQNRNRIPKSSTSDAASEGLAGEEALFREPEGYFKPEKAPTTAEYALLDGRVLQLGLVGESPLWATARYLQEHTATLVRGKDVLELGAGAGLPGIVCGIEGAKRVVITDYPDPPLIENIKANIEKHRHLFGKGSEAVAA